MSLKNIAIGLSARLLMLRVGFLAGHGLLKKSDALELYYSPVCRAACEPTLHH